MNLLPPPYAQTLARDRIVRICGVGGLALTAAALLCAAALVPSILTVRYAQATPRVPIIPPTADVAAIVRAQALLNGVAPSLLATTSPTHILMRVLGGKPREVKVTRISYASGAKGTLILTGQSDSRDAIHQYQTDLQATGLFTNIDLPVDVLVGKQGDFTMTLSGAL